MKYKNISLICKKSCIKEVGVYLENNFFDLVMIQKASSCKIISFLI